MTALKKLQIQDPTNTNHLAEVTDHGALKVQQINEASTAFGEPLASQLTPVIENIYTYEVSPIKHFLLANQSGTITQADAMAVMQTGAAANSSAFLETKETANYRPGLGIRARFTALFTAGVANSTQLAGIGNESDGFFFGYNGTSFGVLHRYAGSPEIRTLTINTASTTAENITITLDGDADATVAVTNSGDTTVTANEIAAHDYSDVGRGWHADAVGSTVVFFSWDGAAHTGSYAISGTTADGSYAQTVAGAAPTETWVAQANWNGSDIFDGNGITGVTLDPTKGNVFQIYYQYLGMGRITFFIEDPDDGELHVVHSIQWANANTAPSLRNPSLPIYIGAENGSNTSNLTVKTGSVAAFVEGKIPLSGIRFGAGATKSSVGNTEIPIFSIRMNEVFKGRANHTEGKILRISLTVDHTKPVIMRFYGNATLVGASWSDAVASTTASQVDSSATSFSGGVELFELDLGQTGNIQIDLSADNFAGIYTPGNSFTVTAQTLSGTGADAAVGLNVLEVP